MAKTVNWKMRQRQGTAAQWESQNPVLAAGEFGYDTTNKIVKIGDGTSRWNALPAFEKRKKKPLEEYTWAEISQIARDWKAPLYFDIGDEKTITLSTGEVITVVIVDMLKDYCYYYDEDTDEEYDDQCGITFGLKNCMATPYKMNNTATNVGGWENSQMRKNTLAAIWNTLPEDLREIILPVDKSTSLGNKSTQVETTNDRIWLFSLVEVTGTQEDVYKDEGEQYAYFQRYGNAWANRLKCLGNDGYAYDWWLRSPIVGGTYTFWRVYNYGDVNGGNAYSTYGVVFGFCV